MWTPDDEQFEAYLKQFRPIAPKSIPIISIGRCHRPSLAFGKWLAAVATILVMGAIVLEVHSSRFAVQRTFTDAVFAGRLAPTQPLTMRSANEWLEAAPSFKAAMDGLAFRPQVVPVPQGKQSALTVLRKEKIRL